MASDRIGAAPGGGAAIPSTTVAASTTTTSDAINLPPLTAGVLVDIDLTTAGSPSEVVTIQGRDPASAGLAPASQVWVDLLASAAIVATGHVQLTVHPAITTVTANVSAAKAVPEVVRVKAVSGNATSHTFTVGITALP